jgi:tetratricopeptide (TPR) repeat protein
MQAHDVINTTMRWNFVAIWLSLLAASAWPASAEPPVNLLRSPSVTLEATSLISDQARNVSALTDGKRETAAGIDAGGAETADFVFGFAGEIVAPEKIVVILSKDAGSLPPIRVEVLASTVSPQSGFKSLRADPISKSPSVQTFAFMPSAARWIMVRLTLPKKATLVSLAEIEILGHPGEPKTNYTFSESPARVIDILARLEKDSPVSLAVSEDEKRAFQKAKAGRLDPATFAEVALLASGVLDTEKRKQYLDRIEAIAEKAKLAVASSKDTKERGHTLLQWLHREVLTKGYRATQTDLSVLLDKNTFNCVSSAVLYNIIALKLGIDVRAIEVPDHAFSIVYQGTSHMDVETTTPFGFNPSRDQIKSFERMTGFRYVADTHRDQRREVTEAGLAALIYYNHGVEFGRAKRYHDALLAYVRAMSLDSEFASAAKNALATLVNWSHELAKEKNWQRAVNVVTIAVELAPGDALLANNQLAIWNNWASSLIEAGQRDEAIAVLKRGAKAVPKGGFEAMQAWVYVKPGEELINARKWHAAMLVAEEGLTKLDPAPRQELVTWRNNLYVRWVDSEIRAGQFHAAADALSRGFDVKTNDPRLGQMASYLGHQWTIKASGGVSFEDWERVANFYVRSMQQFPEDSLLRNNAVYLAQEWARATFAKGGAPAFVPIARLVASKFPALPTARQAVVSVVIRAVNENVSGGKFEKATSIVEQTREILPPDTATQLFEFSFGKWGEHYMRRKEWQQAIKIYDQGLKFLPKNELLQQNRTYCSAQASQ